MRKAGGGRRAAREEVGVSGDLEQADGSSKARERESLVRELG